MKETHPRDDQRDESSTVIFGLSPVLEAIRAARRPLEELIIAEGARIHRLDSLIDAAKQARITIRRSPRDELDRLAHGGNHQGVVARIAAAKYDDTSDLLDHLVSANQNGSPALALVLDGVEDPRNLGAILRTAECAGVDGVFIPERRAVGLTDSVAKSSAGALEYVRVARATNIVRLIGDLKERNIWTVGTSIDAKTDYTEWDFAQPTAVILGGEGEGLRRLVGESCDVLVRIPMLGHIESLNVSVAAGVLLFEAVRQRRLKLESLSPSAR